MTPQQDSGPRVAILGFHLESNAFAPVSAEAQFRSLCYVEGDAITREARKDPSPLPAEVPAFYAEMPRLGPWSAGPIVVPAAEPGGPVDDGFFHRTRAAMRIMKPQRSGRIPVEIDARKHVGLIIPLSRLWCR